MKKITLLLSMLFLVGFYCQVDAQITSAQTGNWNDANTWVGGVIPTSTDNVVIANGHTVTLDISNAECNDLTIQSTSSNTTLRFAIDGTTTGLTIYGNVSIGAKGRFRVETRSPAGSANSFVEHSLTLKGNITITSGGTLDFRGGSNGGGTANGVLLTLDGSSNSTISLNSTTYQSGLEEFNGITINKSGGAKVILASGNLYMSNNSTVGPTILTLTSGNIETSNNVWTILTTASPSVAGASTSSYVIGYFGRGMGNSSGSKMDFPVGDANGYRPISITSNSAGVASGHNVFVGVINSDANTGSSVFAGGIDKVSSVRYYTIGYSTAGIGAAATSMNFSLFEPSYGTDDGISAGNDNLRVAYSTDNRATWTGLSQTTTHTTTDGSTITQITPDGINPVFTTGDITNTSTTILNVASTSGINTGNAIFGSGISSGVIITGVTANSLTISSAAKADGTGVDIQASETINLTDGSTMNIALANSTGGANALPVELNSLNASAKENSVVLTWQTANEVNNYGFEIERKTESTEWAKVGFVAGAGNSNSTKNYSFTDENPVGGNSFSYRLKQVDNNGYFKYYDAITVSFDKLGTAKLMQNNPNPFNPSTTIKFYVPEVTNVTIKIYDLLGREVTTLINEQATAGYHITYWNGKDSNGQQVTSGIYLYRLTAGSFSETKKMLMMK